MKLKLLIMATLTMLVIHCTATPEGRAVSKAEIEQWHLKGRGWSQVGYADMVHLDGTVENLVPYNSNNIVEPWEITNGVKGINNISRHVVYIGGMDKANKVAKDTRTAMQKHALHRYVLSTLKQHPDIRIAGHYHFANKACPSFDVEDWLKSIGVPEENIYKRNTKQKKQ